MANENRRKLYNAMQQSGYDIGSYDDFDRRMNNPQDRVKFYDAVQEAGYDIGGFGDFENRIKGSKYKLSANGREFQVSEREYKDFLARRIGTEGKDPNGSNPFAQNSYVERVEVDVLRKPMKAAEVRKVRETLLGGKTP